MPWLRANKTAWFYEYAKKNSAVFVETHHSVQIVQLDIAPEAFKRPFVTHQNSVITALKRTVRTIAFWKRLKRLVERIPRQECDVVPPQ